MSVDPVQEFKLLLSLKTSHLMCSIERKKKDCDIFVVQLAAHGKVRNLTRLAHRMPGVPLLYMSGCYKIRLGHIQDMTYLDT